MSDWTVKYSHIAEADFAKLPKTQRRRVDEKIEWLEENFDDITPLSLSGSWAGLFKLRVGDPPRDLQY